MVTNTPVSSPFVDGQSYKTSETSRLALATLDPFLVPLTVSIRRGITKTGYRTSTYQRLEEVSEED
jgi:hypothetical protein